MAAFQNQKMPRFDAAHDRVRTWREYAER